MTAKTPTKTEMAEVIARLREGWSWENACSEIFGVPQSESLTTLIFRLKVDKHMRSLLRANRQHIPDEAITVNRESILRTAYEALQWGRATGDGRLILSANQARAEAVGLVGPPPQDADKDRIQRMTEHEQLQFLRQGVALIDDIRKRLADKGVNLDRAAPQIESAGR